VGATEVLGCIDAISEGLIDVGSALPEEFDGIALGAALPVSAVGCGEVVCVASGVAV
jgi:hypothetical protein